MDEKDIPVISKSLLNYLRIVYSTKRLLDDSTHSKTVEVAYGFIEGAEDVISRLENIYKLQQGDLDG